VIHFQYAFLNFCFLY